jgi:acyl-CoA thioesterase FadM
MTDRPPGGSRGDDADQPGRRATLRFRVRFDEAGPDGQIRTSALLRYAADLAWFHSEARGYGRDWYRERGLAWLVRGVELELAASIPYGSELIGVTEAVAARKVIARRDTSFTTADGTLAARLTVDWALTGVDGSPTRIPAFFGTVFTMPDATFAPIRVRDLPPPSAAPATSRFSVRAHELDPMGHVNNAVYLDWAEEAIRGAGDGAAAAVAAVPRRWRLEYLGAAAPAAEVRTTSWVEPSGWGCRIVDAATDQPFVGARLSLG